LDDFHVDAEGGGVFAEVLVVAAVHPGFADRGMGGGDQEPDAESVTFASRAS
jgi:hypothetical protein